MKHVVTVFITILFLFSIAYAELRMPNVFGDKMVLQRDKPVKLWGWANADQEITASLAGQTVRATANGNGNGQSN